MATTGWPGRASRAPMAAPITVSPGSLLHDALGTSRIDVNSFHHQAIDELAPGIRVTATAPDEVIRLTAKRSE